MKSLSTQPERLTAEHDLDQIEARVAHVRLGQQPQVFEVLSHERL